MQSSRSIQTPESTDRPVSVRIVEAVAELEGTDPTTLDPVLYDVLDPDALDSIFSAPGSAAAVEFSYLGYDVVVDADGSVSVTE